MALPTARDPAAELQHALLSRLKLRQLSLLQTIDRHRSLGRVAAGGTALLKVPASGGKPEPATTLAEGEGGHARPAFLPDGRHFLYRITTGTQEGAVVVAALDSTQRVVLRASDSTNVYYSAGHLLFLNGRSLMAQPFDPDRMALGGTPFPIAEDILTLGTPYYGFFTASPGGVLAYQT